MIYYNVLKQEIQQQNSTCFANIQNSLYNLT